MTLEVLTVGRVSVDLYPEQTGVTLAEVRTFRKMLGGSPTNVAVAAARLGRRAAVVTKVGADGFGDYVRSCARRVRRRCVVRRHRPDAAHAAGLLRDPPARRLPAPLLSPADGARPAARRRRPGGCAGRGRAAPLGDRHRAQRGAVAVGDARGPAASRRPRAHRARPRLPPDALARGSDAVLPRGGVARDGARRQSRGVGRAGREPPATGRARRSRSAGRRACAARAAARSSTCRRSPSRS